MSEASRPGSSSAGAQNAAARFAPYEPHRNLYYRQASEQERRRQFATVARMDAMRPPPSANFCVANQEVTPELAEHALSRYALKVNAGDEEEACTVCYTEYELGEPHLLLNCSHR